MFSRKILTISTAVWVLMCCVFTPLAYSADAKHEDAVLREEVLGPIRRHVGGAPRADGTPEVYMIRTDGCPWCQREERAMKDIDSVMSLKDITFSQGSITDISQELDQRINSVYNTDNGVPVLLFFDGDGKLAERSVGFLEASSLVTKVRTLGLSLLRGVPEGLAALDAERQKAEEKRLSSLDGPAMIFGDPNADKVVGIFARKDSLSDKVFLDLYNGFCQRSKCDVKYKVYEITPKNEQILTGWGVHYYPSLGFADSNDIIITTSVGLVTPETVQSLFEEANALP